MDWGLLGFKGLGAVLNIHPVFVHFPIALFPTTLLFYFVGIVWKKEKFIFAGRIALALTFLSTALTVTTGLLAEGSFPHSDVIHNMMETHEKIGIAGLILSGILFLWSFWKSEGFPKARILFLALLALATLAVLQNADIGGRMVFVEGAAVKAAVPPPQEGSDIELKAPDPHHGDGGHHHEEE